MKIKKFKIIAVSTILVNYNILPVSENKILNLIKYAAKGDSTFGLGSAFPAGYHTVTLGNTVLVGQRNPKLRLQNVPYDFNGKTVLDLGSNTGGMIFELADKIKEGVGVDINYKAINAANLLRHHYKFENVKFFTFNLERDNLELLMSCFDTKVDICFMLSLAAWVSNWKAVAKFASNISEAMLFEAHGSQKSQSEQIDFIKTLYPKIILINKNSNDDPSNKNRSLYLCQK